MNILTYQEVAAFGFVAICVFAALIIGCLLSYKAGYDRMARLAHDAEDANNSYRDTRNATARQSMVEIEQVKAEARGLRLRLTEAEGENNRLKLLLEIRKPDQ